jgi:hypothetical protein
MHYGFQKAKRLPRKFKHTKVVIGLLSFIGGPKDLKRSNKASSRHTSL